MLLVIVAVFLLATCNKKNDASSTDTTPQAAQTSAESSASAAESTRTRASFVAVGDNVPNDVLAYYADEQAGGVGDGVYDYRPLFSHIKNYVSDADFSYINQEVHIGGEDIGPRGWPSFNTTDSMADAVVDAGFDFVASASNHSYDWGLYGAIEHSREVWNSQPVAFTGTATSWEEANEIPVIDCNGITFALLDYTYGLGGFDRSEIPEYAVNFIDEDRIRQDVPRAQELADVVLVAMHWGTENQIEPDEDELYYAQLLADLGVDVVLGSHPHVTQPMTWLTGESGNRTLVCYSLGNFIIQHAAPTPNNDLEGMLSCDFVRHDAEGEDGSIEIENIRWIPLVYHGVEDEYSVWALKDYPSDMAERNPAYEGIDDPVAWMREESDRIVNMYGDNFEIDA